MKKKHYLIKLIFALVLSVYYYSANAQTPGKMSYQAVIRDNNGQLLTNHLIGMQIRIIKDTTTGIALFIETHTPTTNMNGLVSLEIGSGNVSLGNFSTIDWANGPYFLKTEIDPNGGNQYTIVGISQLLSVPYAFHAKTAESVSGGFGEIDPVFIAWNKDYSDLTNKPSIADSISTYGFDGNYNSLSNLPNFHDSIISYGVSGNYNDLINKPDFQDSIATYGFSGNYNDLTNKPNIADSISTYGFDGNYNSLSNLPVLFNGNYNNLTNHPDFQDSIETYGFSGNYNDLNNKPNIADSISTYGFDGNYNSLSNLPVLFNGNYNNLTNQPDFQDSIAAYGFSGNYNELTNKPNIADSIANKAVLLVGNQTIQGNKTFTGSINASMQKITNVGAPVQNNDAATKAYVDLLLNKIMELQAEIGVTDKEGNHYKAVKINNQVWMAENLRVTKYKDGTPINLVTDNGTWEILATGARSWYNNDSSNFANTYGGIYNWYAVNTNKLCPTNWHVPSSVEINALIAYMGGQGVAGGKLKSTRTEPVGHPRWNTPNVGATDDVGFSALPGGYRDFDGLYYDLGVYSYWWSSTIDDTDNSYYWGIINNNVITSLYPYLNTLGFSVRCIRD